MRPLEVVGVQAGGQVELMTDDGSRWTGRVLGVECAAGTGAPVVVWLEIPCQGPVGVAWHHVRTVHPLTPREEPSPMARWAAEQDREG